MKYTWTNSFYKINLKKNVRHTILCSRRINIITAKVLSKFSCKKCTFGTFCNSFNTGIQR